jgi:hypothetical protein
MHCHWVYLLEKDNCFNLKKDNFGIVKDCQIKIDFGIVKDCQIKICWRNEINVQNPFSSLAASLPLIDHLMARQCWNPSLAVYIWLWQQMYIGHSAAKILVRQIQLMTMANGLFTRTMFYRVSDATAASKDRKNPIFVQCQMWLSHQTLWKTLFM